MKWVALVIFVSIAAYTALTLHYRRPGPAYQPYQDSKDRVIITRLRSAGYQRITAAAERPADAPKADTALAGPLGPALEVEGGLPEELKLLFVDQPRIPPSFKDVRAPVEANRLFPYAVEFTCALPDNRRLLSGTYVYVKDQEIAIISDIEAIEGDLLTRTSESTVRLTIPAGTLHPGIYQVTLVGQNRSRHWTLQVH